MAIYLEKKNVHEWLFALILHSLFTRQHLNFVLQNFYLPNHLIYMVAEIFFMLFFAYIAV